MVRAAGKFFYDTDRTPWPAERTTMMTFARIRALRLLQREILPFLDTSEALDIVLEIASYQERRIPLNVKKLLLAGLGPVSTIHRRLRRLVKLGVVQQVRVRADKRNIELVINPEVLRIYRNYLKLARNLGKPSAVNNHQASSNDAGVITDRRLNT